MGDGIKSGKEVIDEFFAGILNIDKVDKKLVQRLLDLYGDQKFTDTHIQNMTEQLLQEELDQAEKKNEKD